MSKELTQELVKSTFVYSADGILYRRLKKGIKKCGTKHIKGYVTVSLCRKPHLAHRVIFLYHQGYLPKFIDHIDGDRENNRIENLRECSNSQNNQNSKKRFDNTSGVKGVSFNKNSGKWSASVRLKPKQYYLGLFSTIEDAEKAVSEKREKLHGEFANHGELD